MNRKLTTMLLILVSSLALSGCTLGNKQAAQDKKEEKITRSTNDEDSEDSLFSGGWQDLIAKGKNLVCTVTYMEEGNQMVATSYVAGNKVRSDGTINLGEEVIESHTLIDGDWMYTWSSQSNQGIKFSISQMEEDMEEYTDDLEENVDLDEYKNKQKELTDDYDYKCKVWIPDNSKFDLPEDVTFVDQSKMMDAMIDTTDNIKDMCGVCDSLPEEEAIEKCKESLGC